MTFLGRLTAAFRAWLSPDIVRVLIYGKTVLLSQALSLITVSVIIRFLGDEKFGLYQYALGVIGTTLLVGHLGTDAVSFREFSLPLRHACGALPRILLIRLTGILVCLAVLWLLVGAGWLHLSRSLFFAVAATAVSESFLRLGTSWHRARYLAWADFWTTNGRSLLVLALVLIIVPCFPDARGIALAYGVGAFLILASLLWQWRRILRVGWRTGFRWSGVISPSLFYLEVAGSCISTIPILILGSHHLLGAVGRFSVYHKYLFPFTLAATLAVQSLQPSLVQAFSRGGALGPIVRRGIKLVLGAGLAGTLGSVTVGAFFVVFLGHQTPLNIPLLLILGAFPVVYGAACLVGATLIAKRLEAAYVVSRTASTAACLGTVFLFLSAPEIAAAAGLVFAYALEAAIGAILAFNNRRRRAI